MSQNDYCVIGMGRFGTEVATYLLEKGKKVLIIDSNQKVIERFQETFNCAIIADAANSKVLEEIGIWKVNTTVVCISNVEISAMICSKLKELNVKNVMARAKNKLHKRILTILGVNYAVIPEIIVGKQLGFRAINDADVDMININRKVMLLNLMMNNEAFANRSLAELQLRENGLNIITITRNGDIIFPITPQTQLQLGDDISIACEVGGADKIVEIFTGSHNN